MVCTQGSFFGLNQPVIVLSMDCTNGIVALNGSAVFNRLRCHGVCCKARVYMTIVRLINTANQSVEFCQRVQLCNAINIEYF